MSPSSNTSNFEYENHILRTWYLSMNFISMGLPYKITQIHYYFSISLIYDPPDSNSVRVYEVRILLVGVLMANKSERYVTWNLNKLRSVAYFKFSSPIIHFTQRKVTNQLDIVINRGKKELLHNHALVYDDHLHNFKKFSKARVSWFPTNFGTRFWIIQSFTKRIVGTCDS